MKFLGVSGVFDYAGLNRSSRYRACSCCLPRITRASASGLTVYGAEYPPRLSSVYASLCTSRYPAQDSRPSGSLLLSRKELSSSASCRFIPAHCNRDSSPTTTKRGRPTTGDQLFCLGTPQELDAAGWSPVRPSAERSTCSESVTL